MKDSEKEREVVKVTGKKNYIFKKEMNLGKPFCRVCTPVLIFTQYLEVVSNGDGGPVGADVAGVVPPVRHLDATDLQAMVHQAEHHTKFKSD